MEKVLHDYAEPFVVYKSMNSPIFLVFSVKFK